MDRADLALHPGGFAGWIARGCSLWLAWPALLLCACAHRQDLSAHVERARAEIGVPALSIGLVHGEELVAWGASGERAAGTGEAVQLGDKWHIGSNTKAMTAHLVAILVAEGVLSWETTVAEVFAEQSPAPGWEQVSILDLCRHRSGVTEVEMRTLQFMSISTESPRALRQSWVQRIVLPSSPSADKEFHYANANYMLVGAMLEQLTDTGWEELIRAKLFEPLNMHGAGFGSPGPDQPLGHRQDSEGEWTPVPTGPAADNPAALGPAGTVHIDHLSWTPYLAAHLDMAQGELGADSPFSALHAPPEGGDYAAGWAIRDAPEGIEGPMYIHRGSNTMWLSTVILLPSLDIAFVCNANAADFQPVAEGCLDLLKTTLARRTSP